VPHYRESLRGLPAGSGPLTAQAFAELPLLGRRELQRGGEAFDSELDHARFGGSAPVHTTGSTGEPVVVRRSRLDRLMWEAITLREHVWHRRDPRKLLAAIRVTRAGVGTPPHGTRAQGWGGPAEEVWETGPSAALHLSAPADTQLRWLLDVDPHYLLTFPSNLRELVEHAAARGRRPPRLEQVRTVGETVSAELRALLERCWGVPLVDLYSSNEAGYLALQCPQSGRYHVMSESVLLEVLDDRDRPCRPGEVGRVVITVLHGFATPLIRYDIGDYAEQGAPCRCGRGLPVLERIVGRVRNLVTLPDGRRFWPPLGVARLREAAPVRQAQLVQVSREAIEVHLVAERALGAGDEAALTRAIHAVLEHPFRLEFHYHDGPLPRGPGHKFEEFVSRL